MGLFVFWGFFCLLGCFLTNAICSGLGVPSLPCFQRVCKGEWYWEVKNCFILLLTRLFLSFSSVFLLFILLSLLHDIKEWHSHRRFWEFGQKGREFDTGNMQTEVCVTDVSCASELGSWAFVYIRNINSDLTWQRAPSSWALDLKPQDRNLGFLSAAALKCKLVRIDFVYFCECVHTYILSSTSPPSPKYFRILFSVIFLSLCFVQGLTATSIHTGCCGIKIGVEVTP